jgi:hypothetical protein
MSLSGEKKKAYGDVLDAYTYTILSLDHRLGDAILKDIGDLRAKSGTNDVVTLANMVRYSNRDIFLPLF